MKFFRHYLIFSSFFTFFFINTAAFAQTSFNEDFSSTLGQWQGNTTSYTVTAGEGAVNAAAAGSAYIAAAVAMRDSVSWSVYFRQVLGAAGPSSSNYSRIVLQSDVADVSGAFNGYYLQIGETGNDTIRLFRKNGTTSTKIFSANMGISLNPTVARIKMTRNAAGAWKLFVDNTGGTNYAQVGSGNDNTFMSGGFFGLQNAFTSTNITGKFFYDDINISPLFVDNIAPAIVSATAISATQVDVLFNEPLNAAAANTAANYTINNGIAVQTANLDGANPKLVHLTVSSMTSGTNYSLNATGIKDLAGNTATVQTASFSYIAVVAAVEYDVLINEIMADPTPQVGLPNVEWLEIFNKSTKNINLNTLRLKIGNGGQQVLPNYVMPSNSYAIICKTGTEADLAAYPNVFPITSFALTNTGDSLMLYNATGNLIHKVTYRDSWYGSTTKAGGGYTLELSNVATPCLGMSNWSGSNSATGGTPSAQNSIFVNIADIAPPRMLSATALTTTSLQISFNEPIHNTLTINNFSANNGLGAPQSIVIENDTSVVLTFANAFVSNQNNTLTTNGAVDCAGNVLNNGTISFAFLSVSAASRYDLLINEIYADPTPSLGLPEQEYIEIYNRSTKNIQLQGMLLASGSSGCFLPFYVIQPNTYVIITSTDIGDFTPYGKNFHLSGFPSPSNGGDDLRLEAAGGDIIDAVKYDISWYGDNTKNDGGFSLERINSNKPCETETNWHASNALIGGTPGTVNSINETSLDQIAPQLIRAFPVSPTQIQLYFSEAMNSTTAANPSNFSIDNGIGVPSSSFANSPYFNLITLNLATPLQNGKRYKITANLGVKDCVGNALSAPQAAEIGLPEQADTNDVIINEILFNPNTNGTDFVELYNRSNKVINLSACAVAQGNANGTIGTPVQITTDYLLFPGDYLVLTPDPITLKQQYNVPNPTQMMQLSLPTLDDKTGSIALVSNGNLLDRLDYSEDWHYAFLADKNGVSLERIFFDSPTQNANNWHSAATDVGSATPTYKNSQARTVKTDNKTAELTISPDVISPDGDGFNDFCLINYLSDTNIPTANISVFDAGGRLVKVLARNQLLEPATGLQWDGTNAAGEKVTLGYYIILAELFAPNGAVAKIKKTVVVAAKL